MTLPPMPTWITSAKLKNIEDAAFLSGAALSYLEGVLRQDGMPSALLRDRLALNAAEACVVFSGRPERQDELRDCVHLLRPSDLPGPAGEIYMSWKRAVERRITVKTLGRALTSVEMPQIANWLDRGQGAPVTRAATVLEAVLADAPHAELPALILADAALASALGWDHLVPLFASNLRRADFRKTGDDLRLSCYRAVIASSAQVVREANNLVRKAAYLNAIAPKLRAKKAGEALTVFLTQDAVAPSALPLPDRAARRLCERLVELGAVRELTGRNIFRLYGV